MNQYQQRIIAAEVIGIAILTSIFILIPKDTIILTAYCSLLLAAFLSGASLWQLANTTASDYVTTVPFPLALRGYLAATMAMAVLFVTLDLIGVWRIPISIYWLLQIIVIGITAWKLLILGAAQDAIRQVDKRVKQNVSMWRIFLTNVEAILQVAPSSIRRDIVSLRDDVRFADPMSIQEVAPIEEAIAADIQSLKKLVEDNKPDDAKVLTVKIQNEIKNRANLLKSLK